MARTRKAGPRSWKVSAALFPCELSDRTLRLAKDAVGAAVTGWGAR